MKEPYIIVETWNGVGYSEDNGIMYIKYFENDAAAKLHCKELAKVQEENNFDLIEEEELPGWWFLNGGDAGSYQFFKIDSLTYGISIEVNINNVDILSKEEYFESLNTVKDQAEEIDFEDTDPRIFIPATTLEYDYQFEVIDWGKIDRDDLEITEGGDGVETEIWRHPDTNKLYKVGIEIKRDWDNMELID